MKSIAQWIISSQAWTLKDMLSSEVIKKGPSSPDFAHAIYNLIKGRIDDPDVSDEDIQNLTFRELGEVSGRIAEKMVETLRVESMISRLESVVSNAPKESKPS